VAGGSLHCVSIPALIGSLGSRGVGFPIDKIFPGIQLFFVLFYGLTHGPQADWATVFLTDFLGESSL